MSSNRSQRPAPRSHLATASRSAHPTDSDAVEREIASLERQLREVESELARLKSAREKAKR